MPRTDSTRAIRRIQEACDTCRQKKRKCPGDRPDCSLCVRLGQECSYRGAPHGGRWPKSKREHQQQAASESFGLHASPETLSSLPTIQHRHACSSNVPASASVTVADDFDLHTALQNVESICGSQEFVRKCLDFFFQSLHNQPYPLFVVDGLPFRDAGTSEATKLPSEILSAILALTCVPVLAAMGNNTSDVSSHFVEAAWKTTSTMYSHISPDQLPLSFLQGLCLAVQTDLVHGNVARAQTQIALGISVAQIQGLTSSKLAGPSFSTYDEECKRCVWSLFMLDRVVSAGFSPITPTPHCRFRLALPTHDDRVPHGPHAAHMTLRDLDLKDDSNSGAMPILIQCFLVWGEVVEYVFKEGVDDAMPPWKPNSQFARIEGLLLDYEIMFNPVHRYVAADFPEKAVNEPATRTYYSTWLCFQILLHSSMCLLHHPFNIYQKLHRMAKRVPPTFLQKSYEASVIHSGWVMRLIREMEQAQLNIKDPFYGYLVSIAASIQLEHTRSKHPDKAAAAKRNFETALDFTRRLAAVWPSAEDRTQILLALAARLDRTHTISHSSQNYNGAVDSRTAEDFQRLNIKEQDTEMLRRLLAYARPSESFHASPLPDLHLSDVDVPFGGMTEAEELFNIPTMDDWSFFGEPWTTYMNTDFLNSA